MNKVTMRDAWDYQAFDCHHCHALAGSPCVEPGGGRYRRAYKGGIGHKLRGDVARAARRAAIRAMPGAARPSGFDPVDITDEVWDFEGGRPRQP